MPREGKLTIWWFYPGSEDLPVSDYFDAGEFKYRQFHRTSKSGTGIGPPWPVAVKLIDILTTMRRIAGSPVYINSGYRNALTNYDIGGVSKSRHLTGSAADITIPPGWDIWSWAGLAAALGSQSLGISEEGRFVEVGVWPEPALWGYTGGRGRALTSNERQSLQRWTNHWIDRLEQSGYNFNPVESAPESTYTSYQPETKQFESAASEGSAGMKPIVPVLVILGLGAAAFLSRD